MGSFDGLDVTGFEVGEELVGDAETGRWLADFDGFEVGLSEGGGVE